MIRSAYPDEFGRAKSLLAGQTVPANAQFLVMVKELPVERLIAVIPWWKVSEEGSDRVEIHVRLASMSSEHWSVGKLAKVFTQLERIAKTEKASALCADSPVPEGSPIYHELSKHGFLAHQQEHYFSAPADAVRSRVQKFYRKVEKSLPQQWLVESIRGHHPQRLFHMVAEYHIMDLEKFQSYWKSEGGEHFDADFSFVALDGETVIGLLLISLKGQGVQHVHLKCVHPEFIAQAGLISAVLMNASLVQCEEGEPQCYTFQTDSQRLQPVGNSAIRYGGKEERTLHFLDKIISH